MLDNLAHKLLLFLGSQSLELGEQFCGGGTHARKLPGNVRTARCKITNSSRSNLRLPFRSQPHEGVVELLSPGSYGHGGAWGTQAWIDPVKGVAYVLMVQRSTNSDASDVRREFQNAAVAAMAKPALYAAVNAFLSG